MTIEDFFKGRESKEDSTRSMDRLVNIFYTQALQALCKEAEYHPGCRLPIPVRIIKE